MYNYNQGGGYQQLAGNQVQASSQAWTQNRPGHGANRFAEAYNAGQNQSGVANPEQQTHLIQVYIDDPESAPREISMSHSQGVPIMCILKGDLVQRCCKFKLNIPNGVYTLEQSCGKNNGLIMPGAHWCYPCHRKIATMISKNTIRFKCPVDYVPTKDNVHVSLGVGINFHIGGTTDKPEDDVVKFFYNFGPNRLEELLKEECEEHIRDFIKKVKVYRVRDIKTEMTSQICHEMAEKFKPYGVVIEQVNIMYVLLPKDLREVLMGTTTTDVYLQKQVKQQSNKMLKLTNSENKKMLELRRDNQKIMSKFNHEKDVYEIRQQAMIIKEETEKMIKETHANMHQSTQYIDANSIKALSERQARSIATDTLMKAQAYDEEKRKQADMIREKIIDNATTRLSVAADRSQAWKRECAQESRFAAAMQPMREHEERMAMSDSLQTTAYDGKMVVSGRSGANVLGFYHDAMSQVKYQS